MIAAERYAKSETMAELAEVYGVSEPTIWRALNPSRQAQARETLMVSRLDPGFRKGGGSNAVKHCREDYHR